MDIILSMKDEQGNVLDIERFASLEALEDDLRETAAPDYREKVMTDLRRDGISIVGNGADTDTYVVRLDSDPDSG